ncbi:3-ketoacyl-CoA synthase 5 [Brachypodium distachyon]|uniref:3-ketoacyl-CoA synthase n=1 Tax=Brachypodium distachyon TaxID=15368 RepID=I1GZF8_BRADI|nr:3-ketoacyl-CoA synthase 5 [Brachypodium distachyon]PNT76138.1 hypothetical protein BRADI_1g44840v3 [Brachypodium distachyon]|eukprot:XP_003564030.1 3-ketoacyl-CoA synthase 5 [Brachypodium distachyon]
MSSSRARRHLRSVYKLVLRNLFPITAFPIAAASTAAVVFVAASFGPPYEIVRALKPAHLFLARFLPAAAIVYYFLWQWRTRQVYLVDYACFRGSHQNRIPSATFLEHMRQIPSLSERSVRFLIRLLHSSGLGEETCFPPAAAYLFFHEECTLEASREEAEDVMFSAIDDLFAKTGTAPESIDILVSNCSSFTPTPSFPDMIINRYKMRSNIRALHLSGMGCSAGLVAVELARNLLLASAAPGRRALVVSTETLTPNYYFGNERAMLLPYCLFRMGGAAVLLSTSPANARFRLGHAVRTLTAADDRSYRCIFQEEDGTGNKGANLSKDLPRVAARTLKANITAIAPLVLPASEKILFALSFVSGKLFNGGGTVRVKLRVPDMKAAFEHFCIHAGGRAVIDEVQRSLGLSDVDAEPSRMTLHRFGNTSSSSTWYELAYVEAKDRMRVGDRVWMIGFGSGFKCTSVVLHCIAAPDCKINNGPWAKCIQRYPVRI